MRTTLTLDPDVVSLVQNEVHRTGDPFKQAVNRLIRNGAAYQALPIGLPRFKVRARRIGVPSDWLGGSAQELLDHLDGPLAR